MTDDQAGESWASDFEQVESEADWMPRTSRGQTCATCGDPSVTWLHPLAKDHVEFRAYNSSYTLPTFWTLCDSCETLYAAADDDALLKRMQQPDGDGSTWGGQEWDELARKSLATFRDADLGAQPLGNEPPE